MMVQSRILSLITAILLPVIIFITKVEAGWIDPDTPSEFHTIKALAPETNNTLSSANNNKDYRLVFSDEFNTPGRVFEDGKDPRWTALHKNDYTNAALHFYDSKTIFTNEKGEMEIQTLSEPTDIVGYDDETNVPLKVTKTFKSGMLQGWNKFCFTGGIIEAEIKLPGKPKVGGLWPAFWLLGNLSRHTYVGSADNIWPWSFTDECVPDYEQKQRINPCLNSTHYGMQHGVGRGAPEIDIFEIQTGSTPANVGPFLQMYVGQPFMSATYQVAPGKSWKRPGEGNWPGPDEWYDGPYIEYGNNTCLNINFYGKYNYFPYANSNLGDYWSDAISYNLQLHDTHFEESHFYRLEWGLPSIDSNTDIAQVENRNQHGYLNWYVDNELVLSINGESIHNVTGGSISSEPSYIIFNTGISKYWGFPANCPMGCPCEAYDCNSREHEKLCGFPKDFCGLFAEKNRPPSMKVNYVRVYQDINNEREKVGCSTKERPTRRWIEHNSERYKEKKDKQPLKTVENGGGFCNSTTTSVVNKVFAPSWACGGVERGTCSFSSSINSKNKKSTCICKKGYTGPNCLSPSGFDDIIWDAPDRLSSLGFRHPTLLFFVLLACLFLIFVTVTANKRKIDQWSPIPDHQS